MIFLRLIGNTIAVALVYWAVMLFVFLFSFAAVGIAEWLAKRGDAVGERFNRWKLLLIPGVFVLFWFAGAAAFICHSTPVDSSTPFRLCVALAAILCVGSVGWVFDWHHRTNLELYKRLWPSLLFGAAAVAVHLWLLTSPEAAVVFGRSWSKMVEGAFLAAVSQ